MFSELLGVKSQGGICEEKEELTGFKPASVDAFQWGANRTAGPSRQSHRALSHEN